MIGQSLGPYRIETELGEGGMGVVYRARDQRLDRAVALKVLPERLGHDAAARERLQREARAISALNHPGICTLYDVGETPEGQPFLVMELLEGESLQQRLRRGPLSPEQTRTLGIEIADALEAAHRRGMIHRDLKPGNIVLTAEGHAKLLDFGLAKMVAAAAALSDDAPTLATPTPGDFTQPGRVVGTIAYMSPEQALGQPLDARSDVFSLGLVLYEMLAGQPAFPGSTSAAVFDGILNRTPTALHERLPTCPPALEQAIATAMEKDPARRFASAGGLRDALRTGLTSTAAAPAAARAGWRARRWGGRAAVVVLVCAGGGYWWLHRASVLPAMSAHDTVVLADFSNSTGDSMFDGALRQGLEVQLEQSPYLHLVSEQRMQAEEQLMGLAAGTPVRGVVGEQLCQRTGSVAVLEGAIAQVGSEYNLTLQAVNCSNGDSLASVAQIASDKNHVLTALGQLASGMRAKLGESLASMSQFDTPIEQVTTPSLPALQAYSKGRQELLAGHYASAQGLFTQALRLDPNFAMAYASRGTSVGDLNQSNDTQDFIQAYERRGKVSQRERFYITAHYDDGVTGDLSQAEADYRTWAATYPGDSVPRVDLCNLESRLGQMAAALADCTAAQRQSPTAVTTVDLAAVELLAGQTGASHKLVASALRQHPDSLAYHQLAYQLSERTDDATALAAQRSWLQNQPAAAPFLLRMQFVEDLEGGRLQAARGLLTAGGAPDPGDLLVLAQEEALAGAHAVARRDARTALRGAPGDAQAVAAAALVLAMSGADTRAENLDTRLEQRASGGTLVQQIELPENRAWIALVRHQPRAALTLLQPALPYTRGQSVNMLATYTRGVALLALRQPAAAAAAFQQVLAYPGWGELAATSRLELARAQAALGQNAAARASYQKALAAWAQADADLPLARAARQELRRLRH
ncbi:MAG: protein kinase domain-containing protein [Terriglobales bacterium]